jgi:type I restriction enzyme S subunit
MKFRNGDTLLARITPCLENGKTCYVSFLENEEIGWGSTEYIVMKMKAPFHPFISYLLAKNNDFREFAIGTMSGTSGRQRAQVNALKDYPILIPPMDAISTVNSKVTTLFPKLNANTKQIYTLEKLRDTLLPKLMSGVVRVKH